VISLGSSWKDSEMHISDLHFQDLYKKELEKVAHRPPDFLIFPQAFASKLKKRLPIHKQD
jgi:hypothetical protein